MPPAARTGGRRSSWLLLGAAVVGAFVVGYFVLNALRGNDGAGSPEAAVTRITDAIDHQDPVGVLAAVNPGEVHDIASIYSKLRERVERTGVKGEQPNVEAALFGLENVHFKNPQFRVDRMSDDVAKVTLVGGTLEWEVVPTVYELSTDSYGQDLPDLFRPEDTDERRQERRTAAELAYTTTDELDQPHQVAPFLMTVRRGGGWYVSLTYTVAQHVVEALGLPAGTFDSRTDVGGSAPAGGETPEEAIRGLARAVTDKDVYGGSTYLSSDEAQAARDYAASFQALITRNIAPDESVSIQLDDLRTSTQGAGGGLVRVKIESASGSVVTNDPYDGSSIENFSFDGACLHDLDGDSEPGCIAQRFKDLTEIDKVFVVMQHRGGRYTVSPFATALEYIKIAERAVPEVIVERIVGAYAKAKPDGEVAPGTSQRATTNDAGFAVFTVAGTKSDELSVNGQDEDGNGLDVRLYAPDGAAVPSTDFASNVFVFPATGAYKVALATPDFEQRSIEFRADVVKPTSVTVPDSQSISLEPNQTVALQFDVSDASSQYRVATTSDGDGYVYSVLVASDGASEYCDTGCSLAVGLYTLYVFGSSDSASATVSIDTAQVGFSDGSATQFGTLFDGDEQSFSLNTVPGDAVTVTVTCGGSLDCTLDTDEGDHVDDYLSGESETLTFVPTFDVTSITVGSYSGSGDFELSASS
jgi:hypothetical protein